MATEAIAAVRPASDPARPYAPSWLDLLFDALAALPGPTWLAYLLLTIPSAVLANSAIWLSGLRPLGEPEPAAVFWGIATIGLLAASRRLKVVAGAAFDAFRPALGTGIVDPERARYELTVMPSRPTLVLTVLAFVITPWYYAADPVGSQVVGLTPLGLVPRVISEGATSAILFGILYQAVRQMRTVGRLHDAADRVDPFRPAPLYAFSRLTAQAGFVLIGFNALGLVANPAILNSSIGVAFIIPWTIAFSLIAIAIFAVPLLGMHRRLVATKLQLQGDAEERLKAILGELNRDVDARDLARADALQKTLSSLLQQREVLAKLPTWPWSSGTIRGFGSALLLPLVIFMLQRVLAAAVPA